MHSLLLLLLCGAWLGGEGALPGAQFRVSQKALDYATKTAIGYLDLTGQRIDDYHGKKGHLDYHMTGAHVNSFTKPSSSVVINPGSGITWTAKGASASLHGDWRWHFRWHFIKASDHGTFDIKAHQFDFSISFVFGRDANGRPTIRSTACSASIAKIDFKMHGGLTARIINFFKDWAEKSVRKQLNEKMCDAVVKMINVDAAAKLAQTQVITDIGANKEMILDYRLTQNPTFNPGYMDVMLKGEFAWKSNPKPPPFSPQPFPANNDFSKMAYIWLSDYIVNSFVFAAFDKKKIEHTLTRQSLPHGDGDFLNMTCGGGADGCIGNYLTHVAKEHPTSIASIELEAIETPLLKTSPSEMAFHLHITMKTYLNTPIGRLFLFDLQVMIDAEIFPWIEGTLVKGKIHSLTPSIKTIDTKVGRLTDAFVNWLFEMVSNKYLVKELNKYGEQGLPIPNLKQLRFANPNLRLLPGSMMVSTDFIWTP